MTAVIRPPEDDTEVRTIAQYALPWFCNFGAPPPAPPPPVDVPLHFEPNNDTIRGGKTIWFSAVGGDVADTSLNQPFAKLVALPAPWERTGSGSVLFDARGVVLSSGRAAGSSVVLHRDGRVYFFDAAIDIESLQPKALSAGVVEIASFFYTTATSLLSIIVERDAQLGYLVRASMTALGRTITGQAVLLLGPLATLRLVRHDRFAFVFVGTRETDRSYSQLTKLLEADQFGTDSGTFSFQVSNRGRAVDIRTRFSNFTIESHARIGHRLIDNKAIRFHRIVGDVPAATLQEIGFVDSVAFGPWGEAVSVNGFEYSLPPIRTVGRAQNRALLTVQDVALKDGR